MFRNLFIIINRIKNMFLWTKSFNVENFVNTIENEYKNSQNTNDYGPAICAYYSHMGDLIHNFYGKYWHFTPYTDENRINKLHDKFVKHLNIQNDTQGLELGCGFGHTLEWMKNNLSNTIEIQGLTLSEEEVKHANQKNLNVIQGDYHNIPKNNETYDFVYAIYCLKYSNNLSKVFSEVYRILKPKGRFLSYEILTTPAYNENNIIHKKIVENICKSTNMPPLHSVEEMHKMAENNGFKIISSSELSNNENKWYNHFFLNYYLYYILSSKIITTFIEFLEL